ncbi:MAG: MBL fold metallo-hydrolase [Betaproteobacteria bacterium]|nr:MBL fold metallo-hydrolase [Betaproteobacteria bacterium]
MHVEKPEHQTVRQLAARFVAALPSQLHRIKAFQDNYLWILQDPASSRCWVVDPGDAAVIVEAAEAKALEIDGILLTHHHPDHQGGVDALIAWAAGQGRRLKIYGPQDARIHHDAVAALEREKILFCGDCLFAAGCGRIFEGDPAQMLESLARLCELPDDSLICCAHEYTLSNLRFARAAYPTHELIQARMLEAETLRAQDMPTVPSLLIHELQSNPFLLGLVPASPLDAPTTCVLPDRFGKLRPAQELLGDLHSQAARIDRFAALRSWKNEFRA